ncbi:MAG: hypothetical protein ACYDG2_25365 [Ruminiclostridium sp.]
MDIKDYIEKHFNLDVIAISPTVNGSGNTYDISTPTKHYIVNLAERSDFVSVYQKVQPFLNGARLIQSHIAYSDENLTLYEWLDGETHKELTPETTRKKQYYT